MQYAELKNILQPHYQNKIITIDYETSNKTVGKPGICGEYIIPILTIGFDNATRDIKTMFVRKQLDEKESKQAHHYAYLSELGIPMPKMYGAKVDSNGREILILEYAKEICDEKSFFAEERHIRDFIDLSAKFSCLTPPLEYFGLIGRDMGNKSDTRDWKTWMPWSVHVIEKIWNLASENHLNKDLKELCSFNEVKIDLQKNALGLMQKVYSYEIGVVHSDFRPNNMVILPQENKLGLIDFEDIILDVKHYDIAKYLGAPKSMFKWDEKLRDDYIDFFIDKKENYCGRRLNHSKLKKELFHIWYTRAINMWEWLPHEYGGPSYDYIIAGKNIEERCNNIYLLLKTLVDSRKNIDIIETT
jgi:hypothetical protein